MTRRAKVGMYGGGGSGKTLTATLLAIGLSKELHNHAPIKFFDTEDQADFIDPICRAEGVPLSVVKSRSFIDMRDAHRSAADEGCCALIVDSYSHPPRELEEALKQKLDYVGRRLPFQHREQIFTIWGEWVREMRSSPLHVFLNGRLSWEWDEEDDDAGDARPVKIGTKMRGDADAGYEPDLLIEMDQIRTSLVRDRKTKTKRGNMKHAAVILKDRWMVLNGKTFVWNDLNRYEAGDYKKVFADFRPHFDCFAPATPHAKTNVSLRSSQDLFHVPHGENKFAERSKRVTIALEEIQGILNYIWPGRTDDDKRMRGIVQMTLFATRSWTALEGKTPEELESALLALRTFEPQWQKSEKSESKLIALMQDCKDALHEAAVL